MMHTARGLWLAGLSRGLRLAGVLSATAPLSSSSSTTAKLTPIGDMAAPINSAPRALRGRLVRHRPGFVPSWSTSTCGWGGAVEGLKHVSSRPVARAQATYSKTEVERVVGSVQSWPFLLGHYEAASQKGHVGCDFTRIGATRLASVGRESVATAAVAETAGKDAAEEDDVGMDGDGKSPFKVGKCSM